MKKLFTLTKTLLVATGLCVGTSVWAYDVPSGYEIKTVYVGTNNGDGTVTADAFDYESVPTAWVAQSGCALSIKNITYVENAAVGSTPEGQPTYVNGKTLCTTVSGTSWEYHYSRYTMAEAVNSGYLVFRADMYCSNSPTYIRFLDEEGNELLLLGFNNGSGDKYYQFTVNGGSKSNSDMHTTYRSYHGFALEDLVINLSTGAVSFWLDYINTNSSNQRTQVTNTKSINIGTGKSIKYIELGSVVNNSQAVSYDNIKFYYVDRTVDKYTYSIKAVDDDDNELRSFASGWCYSDEPATVNWSKFIYVNDTWYTTNNSTFSKTITENTDDKVTYTPSNISYFYEFETLSRHGGANTVTETGASRSNNKVGRIANSSTSYATLYTPSLSAGVYDLFMPYYNGNNAGESFYVYVTNNISSLGDPVKTFSIDKTNTGTFSTTLTIPEGYFVAFRGVQNYSTNSKARIDYLTLTPKVTATIGTNGYTTFSSAYPLALGSMTASTGDVTAYYATAVGGSSVTLTSIAANVEAGEGLILKGTAGATITIPVAASGSSIDNYLVGCPTETVLTTNASYYVLVNNGATAEFQRLNEHGATIPAGKAYLNVEGASSRLSIVFDDNSTTSISTKANSQEPTANSYYDLQGRRVAQPTKGLYIVNGKKVVVK